MPKARRRKQGTARGGTTQARGPRNTTRDAVTTLPQNSVTASFGAPNAQRSRLARASSVSSPQSLIFPALVALGCWGMAFSFFFLYNNDSNHTLYGGMAILIALLWSFNFSMRLRKLLAQRQGTLPRKM